MVRTAVSMSPAAVLSALLWVPAASGQTNTSENGEAVEYSAINAPEMTQPRRAIPRGLPPEPESISGSELIVNGGFESGDFTGWQSLSTNPIFGDWFIFDEFFFPLSGIPPEAPPEGRFGAITDMVGPGTRFLYQDVTLGAGQAVLRFVDRLDNLAGFYEPGLQEYRVDVVEPGTPGAETVLRNLFITEPGDPVLTPFTLREYDLSEFANQTIRIRFTQTDNFFFFNARVDAVSLIQAPSCNLRVSGAPVPAIANDPFALFVNFTNTGPAFQGTFDVFTIAGGDVVPLEAETAELREGLRLRRFPIFSTLTLNRPTPSIGFLVTVTDTPSDALLCSDVLVVPFGVTGLASTGVDENGIRRVAERFLSERKSQQP